MPLAMVITRFCWTVGVGAPTDVADRTKLKLPAVLGVPVIVPVPTFAPPDVKTRLEGAAPAEIVGVGTPLAVILKVGIAVPTVPANVAALVKLGVTGVAAG